ncbi:MAG TPA: translation initiation factor IF-2 N-terminal domain-containing protein, partial [Smithellaceae bacterium]|nr:translation initiation factor IF-2 N-terminal domain-containing protein [Smithellaceae bacterium]
MPKKRVYELAKELGLENKDLIAHLERIGISVKSHSSSLEDEEVERIKDELLAKEPRKIVEERIKSTVIRRRAVRPVPEQQPVEEKAAGEEREARAEEEKKPAVPEKKKSPAVGESSAPAVEEKREETVRPEITPAEKIAVPEKKEEAKSEVKVEKAEIKAAAPSGVKIRPGQPVPFKPATIISRQKIERPEPKKEIPPKPPAKPGGRIVIPPADKAIKREFEKPKKKGKIPVEVFIEEEKEVPRRKVLEKKIEKKLRKQDDEREVVFSKWRDERKVAPVKMKKTEITVPKAIKRRIKIGETITVGDLAKRMGVKASEVISKLMGMGVMSTINQAIDYDIATLIAGEFSFHVESAEVE